MLHLFRIKFSVAEQIVGVAAALGLITAAVCHVPHRQHAACGDSVPNAQEAKHDHQTVKVIAKRDGQATRFFVDNKEYCEVTMTFDFALSNIKGDASRTIVAPPRKVTEVFVLEPEDASLGWDYSYTNYYKLGSSLARHDDTILYRLPYAPGERFKVTQAFGGGFSHKGSNKYAIDWKMSQGTPVHAARGGEVVKTRDDSSRGGPSMKYDVFNNFVLIRHDDGTLGHYCHLLKGSVTVKPGERVTEGRIVAKSGNTGFSSGPHLHFCVFKTSSGKARESVPIKFRTEGDLGTTLVAGRNYRATEVEKRNATAQNGNPGTITTTAAGASGS